MESSHVLSLHIEADGAPWEHVKVQRLAGREAISQLFAFELDVVCDEEHELPEQAYPGAEVTLVFELDGRELRRVHGMLGPIRDRLEASDPRRTYRLRLVPRAFRLTLVETQEVFLDLTVPQILARKLEMHGLGAADVELRLLGTYAPRELVVQYGESDLAFISRLAEHLGISFFFEHEGGHDKLVLTDHAAGFRPVLGFEAVPFRPRGEAVDVFSLEVTTDLLPGTYFIQDYNYRTPKLDLTGQHVAQPERDGGIVEYGSHVKSPDEAARLAQIRAEERLARERVFEGKSSRPTLSAGRRVALLDHPRLAQREELLLVEVEHEASFPLFGEAGAAAHGYRNTFRAIASSVVFRPARRTPKPRIPGVVTGVVQPGPGGETGGIARLDGEGRYTIQLHFDTAQPGQQKASHPVRLAQPFAGEGNAMHFPLLPGTEVLVAFANGDPDRPVIVGAMPNPTSPSAVVADEAHTHRIRSSQGVIIEFGATVPGRK